MKAPASQNGKASSNIPQQSSTSPVPIVRNLAPGSSVIGPPGSVRTTSAETYVFHFAKALFISVLNL